MSAAVVIGAILAVIVGAFEVWRKWPDGRRERPSVWIEYDHGSDAYADLCDGAAGNAGEISPRSADPFCDRLNATFDARRGDA